MADSPEVKEAVDKARNRRRDGMYVAAYIAVAALIYLVAYEERLSEFAQGAITMALGNFMQFLIAMHSFEFGTTRGNITKDQTIAELSKQPEVKP